METLREPSGEVTLEPDSAPLEAHFDFGWLTRERIMRLVDIAAVVLVAGFVLGQLGLGNLLTDNTPAGGDMGAHVWGPAFLRDHLLPHFRLSGWTPDWSSATILFLTSPCILFRWQNMKQMFCAAKKYYAS